MQGEVFFRPAGVFGELRRKQRGGIGDQDRFFRHQRGQLFVKRDLLLRVFRHGFDDQVGVPHRFAQVQLQLQARVGFFHLGQAGIFVKGVIIGNAPGPSGRRLAFRGGHLADRLDVDLFEMVQFGLCARDAALAAQPDGHIEPAVRGLEGNLAAQNAAARHNNIFHG